MTRDVVVSPILGSPERVRVMIEPPDAAVAAEVTRWLDRAGATGVARLNDAFWTATIPTESVAALRAICPTSILPPKRPLMKR